jgi:hypothetical protein
MLKPAFTNNAWRTIQPSVWYFQLKRWQSSAHDCELSDRPSTNRTYKKAQPQERHERPTKCNFGDRWNIRLLIWNKPANAKSTDALQTYCLEVRWVACAWPECDSNQKEETYPDAHTDLTLSGRLDKFLTVG